jgi:hypothetical protein
MALGPDYYIAPLAIRTPRPLITHGTFNIYALSVQPISSPSVSSTCTNYRPAKCRRPTRAVNICSRLGNVLGAKPITRVVVQS